MAYMTLPRRLALHLVEALLALPWGQPTSTRNTAWWRKTLERWHWRLDVGGEG